MASRPRVTDNWLVQRGHKALELAIENRSHVEPRLAPALLDGLRDDVEDLAATEARVLQSRQSSAIATATQNKILKQAHAMISALGGLVRRNKGVPRDVRKAYGVGVRINPGSVASVLGAGAVLVQRATNNPEEARALGVLDSDIETLRATLKQLEVADREQEAKLAARPRNTRMRNAAARRIYDGIQAIAGAGVAAFALDARLRNRFDALDNLPKTKKKKT